MRALDVRPHRRGRPSSRRQAFPLRKPAARASALLLAAAVAAACSADRPTVDATELPAADGQLFSRLPSAYTGVTFENRLEDTRELNVFTYRNYYNGGGVGLGDLNGDGLPDLVLTSNQRGSRVYLNEGAFRFRDITAAAGLGGRTGWATGVTIADVDGDGMLDIYICYAGRDDADRANALYINRGAGEEGVPTFEEKAADWGIADAGYTTHAAFFDYDRDGRLDLYLVNNSFRPVSSFGLRNIRHVRDPLGGDKLFRNMGGRYDDVSEAAGIYGSEIGFGLGVAVTDVNRDGWPDLYVSNDFFERDYLYINRRDGTFSEELERQMPYASYFSMGLDAGDIDNDGWPDIYVTDMLPEDDRRLKLTSSFEGWDVYQTKLRNGYHHQFMRNMLHRNNGDGTFSEIGQLAGVARTDWSWSALIADWDQDGLNDLFVTNGLARDVTSQDYISFLADDETMAQAQRGEQVDFLELVEAMTSTPLPNYAFRNRGDLTFSSEAQSWGLDTPAFSNGAAYGDLDGDGALDLVVNNVNGEAFVYRNNARTLTGNRYLQVKLVGAGANRFAVGAKVVAHGDGRQFFRELVPSRGFQSSVDYVLTFGLGALGSLDSVIVEWPDGRASRLRDVAADQRLVVAQAEAQDVAGATPPAPADPVFRDVTERVALGYTHVENTFADFDRERLIPKLVSTDGPFMAVADVNGDGLDDAFFGGAKDQPGRLLIQRPGGGFIASSEAVFERDRVSEDMGAAFLDADGDGSPDLYVVSGGSEFSDAAPALQDRLYLNDGRGAFTKAADRLPPMNISGSRVAPADFDGDGDIDLFVGGRVVPWRYGIDPQSVLLQNDGAGRFTDVTNRVAPGLERVGMVTDAVWQDVVGDGRPDLVVVGEWMPVAIFRNADGRLERLDIAGLERGSGWWNRIIPADLDGDGRTDFVVGNLGLNGRLRASAAEPATMHVKDFAGTGFVQQILSMYVGGKSYPIPLRDDLIKSLPALKARYLNYADYAGQTVTDVFPGEQLADAVVRTAHTFATSIVMNRGDGGFELVPLPNEAQIAPVHAILADDFDRDGRMDLLLAGNFGGFEPELGAMTAGYGLFLRGDGAGGFTPVPAKSSGFRVTGEARDIGRMRTPRGELLVVTRNDGSPLVFEVVPAVHAARTGRERQP